MIDPTVLKRDAQANILDWPVIARHLGRSITVGLMATQDIEVLLSEGAGLLDDMSLMVTAISDDFGDRLPKHRDEFQIQLKNGKWKKFEVSGVPDYYDPLTPTITINLQSPHKG